MAVDLLDIISIVTVFQLLLLAIFLIGHKKGNRISNRILSVFLFSNALLIANFILFRLKILTFDSFSYISFIGRSSYFLLMPLLYLYTRSLCYRNFALKKMDLLHLLPFAISVSFLIIQFNVRAALISEGPTVPPKATTPYGEFIFSGALHTQILLYIIATLQTLRIYRSELKKLFSSVEHIDLSWLLFLLIAFVLMWIIDVTNFVLSITKTAPKGTHYIMNLISLTINFIFATVIVYRGLKQPETFSGIEEKPKYTKQKLSASDSEQYVKQLTSYMESQKPYLAPSLSLNDLAWKMAMSSRLLSQVINESMNQNFFDFVNSYRIEEAKRIFLDPSSHRKTVLEVLYDVGFNSKSVFNSAFKKHTGMTPTRFKKLHKV